MLIEVTDNFLRFLKAVFVTVIQEFSHSKCWNFTEEQEPQVAQV